MALRATKPEPEEPDAIHEVLGHWKMGRWHDVGLWQRALGPATTPPREPLTFAEIGIR